MKLKKWALVMAAVLTFGSVACAEEAQTETVADAVTGTLSGEWSDFQIQIAGEVYQFPMMHDEWIAYGWEAEDDVEEVLEPYQYEMVSYQKDGLKCTAYVLNFGINNAPIKDCLVGGVTVDNYFMPVDKGEVMLPGGLERGKADVAAIEAAYGTPSDSYEGDLYTKYTYSLDYDRDVELTVYKESGVLEEVRVRNFIRPEGFDEGEISTEVPADIAEYEKPAELSSDLGAYEIELGGKVYAVPVPVSVLLEDGWKINESDTDEYVMAHSSGWVGLIQGGQKMRSLVRNNADYATLPENCWFEELEVGGYDLDMDGALPGGIKTGMSEDEFRSILENADMEYEVEESGDFKYYTYNKKNYDQCFEAIVYTAEGGNFTKDSVIEVKCSNPCE